ncbi:hypothetical protein [Pandoraea captiosa]|jgi:hypothetical protein|nr:hypothetical protein [Pandoraea captiosa]
MEVDMEMQSVVARFGRFPCLLVWRAARPAGHGGATGGGCIGKTEETWQS